MFGRNVKTPDKKSNKATPYTPSTPIDTNTLSPKTQKIRDKFHLSISSRATNLVTSPDGKSIQLAPESPRQLSPKKRQVSDSTTNSPIFRDDIRQEWINAIFGKEFLPVDASQGGAIEMPPKQGIGLAGIPYYLSYAAIIPGQPVESRGKDMKVGVTLSRIPIGIYVRMVDIKSEAYDAGIIPGSILVEINGMGVLGEPSHKLLERLWLYEGHLDFMCKEKHSDKDRGQGRKGSTKHKQSTSGTESGDGASGRMNDPIALRFIKDGHIYDVVLFTKSSFGISWAPCGNFALVQRSYAFAQKAGVRRGCIVAAVNSKSLRLMDHLDTALELKETFNRGEEMRVICVYTPAASRTGYHERSLSAKDSRPSTDEIKTVDGLRIRRVAGTAAHVNFAKPVEYGGTFFMCGVGSNQKHQRSSQLDGPSPNKLDIVSEFANRVAAGEMAAPTDLKRVISAQHNTTSMTTNPGEKYCVCPTLQWSELLQRWSLLDSLVFCLQLHAAEFNEDEFHAMGGVVGLSPEDPKSQNETKSQDAPPHSRRAKVELIKTICFHPNAREVISTHALQLVALIASNDLYVNAIASTKSRAESSIFNAASEDESDANNRKVSEQVAGEIHLLCDDIIEAVVNVAMVDDELCQSLHFLLRSFTSALAKYEKEYDCPFSPMKMMTSAHLLLRNRLVERDSSERVSQSIDSFRSFRSESLRWSSSGQNIHTSLDSIDESDTLASSSTYKSHPSPNKSIHDQESAISTENESSDKQKSSERRSRKNIIKKMFRGKKKKDGITDTDNPTGLANSVESAYESEPSLSLSFTDGIESPTSPKVSEKNAGKRPMSILRKSVDQEPSYNESSKSFAAPQISSTAVLFENMGRFLSGLDQLCGNVERALLKSFSQKLTEWALQPWSANKDRALAEGTKDMRKGLYAINNHPSDKLKGNVIKWSPVMNPVDSSELLISLVPEDSYILPTAHFPILLTFNAYQRPDTHIGVTSSTSEDSKAYGDKVGEEAMYRTQVEFLAIKSDDNEADESDNITTENTYVIHSAVAGQVQETGRSTLEPYYGSKTHRFLHGSTLQYETKSSTGCPRTIALLLSSASFSDDRNDQSAKTDGRGHDTKDVGCAWVDISTQWQTATSSKVYQVKVWAFESLDDEFDQHGQLSNEPRQRQILTIEVEVKTEILPISAMNHTPSRSEYQQRRMLLYKHDDDMRQEMLALNFIRQSERILQSSGLDLKLKQYKCIPVGERKGFIEWVNDTVSLSEICKPMGSSCYHGKHNGEDANIESGKNVDNTETNQAAFVRSGNWCKFETLRGIRHNPRSEGKHGIGLSGDNPVQDFLRSNAYDPTAPYFIRRDVMDNFVKSCAGYSVITYLLGVGDRHTDNLLLHPNGYFLHCDYSFILGQDPKTYLPMRITNSMINGMGGRDSDNFAKFLSLAGAAFVTLRQASSVRTLLAIVRGVAGVHIPDVSETQSTESALHSMRNRFRLDLNDDEAVTFLEENIERSISSKIWIAVDAIHSIGKKF